MISCSKKRYFYNMKKILSSYQLLVLSTFFLWVFLPSCVPLPSSINGVTYTWKTRTWSSCVSQVRCGEGHRTREVACQESSGFIVSDSNCDDSKKPMTVDSCFRVCEQHKDVLRWRIGEWSHCTSSDPRSSTTCIGTSISGVARRDVRCVFGSMQRIVDSSACENFWDRPDTEMSCSLDCPQDCILARTNVSCQLDGCLNIGDKEGYDVIVAPSEGGFPCPESELLQPFCHSESLSDECYEFKEKQKRYVIKVQEWGPCEAAEDNFIDLFRQDKSIQISLRPVLGIRRRNITCLTDEGAPTNLSFCKVAQMPVLVHQCVIPVHCRTSPWSEWRVKQEGCITSDGKVFSELRSRFRRLIQMPLGPGAEPCPPLYEERSISQDLPSCYKYQWLPLEWSDCEVRVHGLHKETKVIRPTCKSGLKYRNITCVRANDMVPVDEEWCREVRPPLIQRCKVPCRTDCQVSEWSRWGPCSFFRNADILDSQLKTYRVRARSVLVQPSSGGDPCPHLEESDICIRKLELWQWQYGKWSNCTFADARATCGQGNRTRNKTCVKLSGDRLDDLLCAKQQESEKVSQQCTVPCPNDCVLSSWSEWSVCSIPCFTKKEGVKFRNRTLIAVPGQGGASCSESPTEEDKCSDIRCEPYKWMPREWSSCHLKNESKGCGIGIQTRQLNCMLGDKVARSKKLCTYTQKPETEQKCHIPCPIDCIATNFSDWTPCKASCGKDSVQYRRRLLLQSPRHGGKACPESLLEERTCSKEACLGRKTSGKNAHRWITSPWGKCHIPIIEQNCGMGFQVRNVSCVDDNDSEVEPHYCLKGKPSSSQPPSAFRSCEVTCSNGCVLTVWSAWSPCGYSYDSRRTRHRELVGSLSETSDCSLTSKRVEEEKCPIMPSSTALEGRNEAHWMSCIVEKANSSSSLVNGQLVEHRCGGGYRYMFDMEINSETGTGPGLESDYCWQDCPVDCQMSEWSTWSECNVPCGNGFRERKRNILMQSNHLGRPCPDGVNNIEIQRDMCHIVCSNFHWSVGGWSECLLSDRHSSCGNGMQFRSVKCLDKRSDQGVDEKRCDPLEKPDSSLPCRIHCPGECVVSGWEITRKCAEPCSNQSYKEMKRTIIRQPDVNSEPCPPLVSRTPCVLNDTCFEHSFVKEPWGSCVLPDGAVCGEGLQMSPVLCMRSDGRQVDAVLCEKSHKSLTSKQPASQPCYIQCPIDCIVSEWSAWNATECLACGKQGTLHRSRYVLQSPSDAGQPCPSELVQKKPCPFKPCYLWKHSNWSTCDLEGADCGNGVRRRLVECVRYDGLQVDKIFCLTINVSFPMGNWLDPLWLITTQEDSEEEQFCLVPCPGDCIVSEWSRWSHCHKNCRIGQIIGYQTSSRKILYSGQNLQSCPQQLWQTRPCWADDCNFFRWKLRKGSLTCEGRDGTIVEGGCTSESPPCEYWCDKLGGKCNTSTGLCHCEIYGISQGPVMTGPTSASCSVIRNGPRPPANHSAPTPQIHLKYYPDDNQVSFWMYAMITIGSAFVIFVAVTVYLMCRSSLRQRSVSVERQPSVRRRVTTYKSTGDRSNNASNQNGSKHSIHN